MAILLSPSLSSARYAAARPCFTWLQIIDSGCLIERNEPTNVHGTVNLLRRRWLRSVARRLHLKRGDLRLRSDGLPWMSTPMQSCRT